MKEWPPRVGSRPGHLIELRLQPRGETLICSPRWSWTPDGRHLAPAQLTCDLFPNFRAIAHVRNLDDVKRQPCRPEFLVVTRDAVLVEHRAIARHGRGGRLRVGQRSLSGGELNHNSRKDCWYCDSNHCCEAS